MEAALYHRWNLTLKLAAVIEHGQDKETLAKVRSNLVQKICDERNWDLRDAKINGRKWPGSAYATIKQLREDGTINDWPFHRFTSVWMGLRNTYSHLEFVPIDSPNTRTLARAAEQRNMLFDSART